MLYKPITKIICLLIIIGLNWTGLLAIGKTFAYFSDAENSNTNIYQTGTLDMTVRSGQGNFVSGADNMTPGKQVNRDIYVGETAFGLPLKYNVSFEFISGDIDLCNQLDLKIWYDHYFDSPSGGYANRDMRLTYDGPLSSLVNLTDVDFIIPHPDDQFDTDPSDGTEQWFFYSIILPSNITDSFQGKVCNFNFAYEAWQTNLFDSSQGFTDEEKLENTIKTGYWNPPVVLNEFLPNAGNYPEFIELYNKTNLPINLDGFYIMAGNNRIDINFANTLTYSSGLTTIAPSGWLVITAGGNLLDDASGTLILYNQNDVEVDSYTYDASDYNVNNTPGWTNNLIGYWPFDNDVQDKSGNGNDGTDYSSGFVVGKINQALSFDGQDDYIEVPHSSSLNISGSEITLEAWIKINALPSAGERWQILGKADAYALQIADGGGGKARVWLGPLTTYVQTDDPEISTGVWYHLVGIYDSSSVKIYINGVLKKEVSKTGNQAISTNNLIIGARIPGGYFNGIIDEVKIYDRALSADEVLKHYNDVDSSGAVPVDKSYARIPDGSSNWVDPIPTPGAPNQLSEEEIGGLEWQEELTEEPISDEVFDEVEKESEIIIESEEINTDEEITTTTEESIITEATTTNATTSEAISTEATTTEATTTDSGQEATTTEEIITAEVTTETSGETTEDVIEEVIEEVTDEPIIDEIGDEIIEEIIEETPIIEEPVIEQTPIDEVPATEPVESLSDPEIQQADDGASIQASEEQPVVVPDNSSEEQTPPAETNSSGEDSGSGEGTTDNITTTEGVTE